MGLVNERIKIFKEESHRALEKKVNLFLDEDPDVEYFQSFTITTGGGSDNLIGVVVYLTNPAKCLKP